MSETIGKGIIPEELNEKTKEIADDFKKIGTAAQESMKILCSAMSAGVEITSLLGAKQENLAKIQAKLQSAISAAIAVQQVAQALNKESYLIHTVLPLVKAKDAAASALLSGWITKLGISTGVANVAARGLMITLTGGVLVAVWGAIAVFDLWNKKQEESKRKIEETRKTQEEFANAFASSASEPIAKLMILQEQYGQLGDNMQAKQKFIKDNKAAFDELGVSIKSVSNLENLLIKNTGAYIASVLAKSRAEVFASMAKEKISQQIGEEQRSVTYKVAYKAESKTLGSGRYMTSITSTSRDEEQTLKNREGAIKTHNDNVAKLGKEAEGLIKKSVEEQQKAMAEFGKGGFSVPSMATEDSGKAIQEKKRYQEEYNQLRKQLENESTQKHREAEIEMTKGTREEIEKRYQYLVEDIAKKEEIYKESAKKAEAQDPDMSGFAKQREQLGKEKEVDLKVFDMEKSKGNLIEFENLAKEYIDKYNELDKLKKTASDPEKLKDSGMSTAEITALIKQQETELSGFSIELTSSNSSMMEFMRDVVGMGLEEAAGALGALQTNLQVLQLTKPNDKKIPQLQSQISLLKKQLNIARTETKAMSNEKDGSNSERWKNTHTAVSKIGGQLGNIADSFGDVSDEAKVAIDFAKSFVGSSLQMIENIGGIVEVSSEGMTTSANGAATSMQQVEKASMILAVISAAIQIVMKIIELVKNKKAQEAEARTDAIKQKIKDLEKEYDNLQKSIEKAYSTDAANLIKQGNDLLDQQKQQLELLIAEQEQMARNSNKEKEKEKAKENAKVAREELEGINEQIEENNEKMVDVIMGEDVKSAIDRFADYYVDSFGKSSEEIKAGQKKMVADMVRNMVTELIKASVSNKMEKLREYMATAMAGGFSEAEDAIIGDMIENMYEEADAQSKVFAKYLENNEDGSREADEAKGIARASQESVDENNALLNIQVAHSRELVDGQRRIIPSIESMRNDLAESILLLKGIKDDTGKISADISDVKKYSKETKDKLEEITTKGITIKR